MGLEKHKWDAQVGDVAALAPFPLVLSKAAWQELKALSLALAQETVRLEMELLRRPDLHARMDCPRSSQKRSVATRCGTDSGGRTGHALRFPPDDAGMAGLRGEQRCMRWVYGVLAFPRSSWPRRTRAGLVCGDPGAAWTNAIAAAVHRGGLVVLLSAPGWVEDLQVVAHLAARLRQNGVAAQLASPHHLRWAEGRARIESQFLTARSRRWCDSTRPNGFVDLPCQSAWMPLFRGGLTPVSNPGCAAFTESKRLPLVWSEP